jgi:hypothetical protein
MGWSDYADFTSENSLVLSKSSNVYQALMLAVAERSNKTRNTVPYVKFKYLSSGLYGYNLTSFYYTILNFLNNEVFCYADGTPINTSNIGITIIPPPNDTKLLHYCDKQYVKFFHDVLNKLVIWKSSPFNYLIEAESDYHYYTYYGTNPPVFGAAGTAFNDMRAYLASNPFPPDEILIPNFGIIGGWRASCITTNNNVWSADVNRATGTFKFSMKVTLNISVPTGSNNTWIDLNLTDLPTGISNWVTDELTVSIPQFVLGTPPTDPWGTVNGTSNEISQSITWDENSWLVNGGFDGGFEFIEGS